MDDRNGRMRRPARAPVRATTRRRWVLAAGIGGMWFLLWVGTGSMILATVFLVLLTVLAGACVVGLRALGIDRDHPWMQRMAERPWRDGRDVLHQALRHLPELFLVTPSGSLLAPNVVELYMNPDDLAALTDMMDLDLINASAAEVYQAQITDSGARLGSDGPVGVRVAGDPALPAGRYRVRQGRPVTGVPPVGAGFGAGPLVAAGQPAGAGVPLDAGPHAGAGQLSYAMQPGFAMQPGYGGQPGHAGQPDYAAQPDYAGQSGYAGQPVSAEGPQPGVPRVSAVIGGRRVPFNGHDGYTQRQGEGEATRTAVTDLVTVAKPPAAPPLRLITNGSVVETRLSGARAGRGGTAELVLPAEPTVSRVHAKFTFTNGQWWITSFGRNGVTLNGVPVAGDRPVSDGDTILWGRGPEALMSRVRIGA